MTLSEKAWAIKHTRGWEGFYYGTYCTRREAIEDHIRQIGGTWKRAYRFGDRAVKVLITEAGADHP
jgi:hypothetical protein